MKSIRTMLLVFAVTVIPFTAQWALAQQEVDPDHYDYPTAAKPAAMARSNKAAVHHHARSNANLASKQAKPSADIASNSDKPTSQTIQGAHSQAGDRAPKQMRRGAPALSVNANLTSGK
jgi:hypothetical protein